MSIFPGKIKNILITGGSGFIGGNLIRKLLVNTRLNIFNLDKLSYASDLWSIKRLESKVPSISKRYKLLEVDLADSKETLRAIEHSDPDLVFHLAAESHVDRSILRPQIFLESNIIGTYNLLESLLIHWEKLPIERKDNFRMLHISTDEVFGSLENEGLFSETSPYDPKSPYSATKAASDHLVKAWNHTYGLPALISNSSNNFGPWQFPEKLIPVIILNAIENKKIPIYGDGENIRDWIFVEDHINALIQIILKGKLGNSYCIGGGEQKTNNQVTDIICRVIDKLSPINAPHIQLKSYVKDRAGHDKKYAISNKKINSELNWSPIYNFEKGINLTIKWYYENQNWCQKIKEKRIYSKLDQI